MEDNKPYYLYGSFHEGSGFTDCYHKEKLGRFKLVLLCLRRAFFYVGEKVWFAILITWKEERPVPYRIIMSAPFLLFLTTILSVPGFIVGMSMNIPWMVTCSVACLALFAITSLCVFVKKLWKLHNKYVKKESKYVKKIKLVACKHNDKIYFHVNNTDITDINTHQVNKPSEEEIKNAGIDLNFIPRSLVKKPSEIDRNK